MTVKMTHENCMDFENALTKCGFGKFNYILITLAGGLMACGFLELTSVTFIMPVAECDLNLTTSDKGVLSAIGYVGVILSSHLWGFLSDTKGRRKTLIASLLMASAFTSISSFVNSFWLLVLLRFLNGFCISCASSTSFAYLGEFHNTKNQGRVIMTASILYSIISASFPAFANLTINQDWRFNIDFLEIVFKPWRLFLLICGLPSLICALILIFILPESPKFTYAQGDETKTLEVLRVIHRMNNGKSQNLEISGITKTEEFVKSSSTPSQGFFTFMWTQSAPLFKGSHLRNILTACFIQFALCLTTNGFWTFMPEIMNKISLWNQDSRGLATVCEIFNADLIFNETNHDVHCNEKLQISTYLHVFEIEVAFCLSYAIMSLIINKTGKLVLILVIVFSTGASAMSLIFIQLPLVSLYTYLFMLLSGLTISVVNASTIELFPTNLRAMAVCFSMMIGRLGSVVGSIVIGFFIDNYCELTFLMPTVLLFTSGFLAFTIPNISKK